jgi:hypothetical protein
VAKSDHQEFEVVYAIRGKDAGAPGVLVVSAVNSYV